MNNQELVAEVTEDFEMVLPGDVYPSVVEAGEVVTGRVAEIAIALEKAIARDGNGGGSGVAVGDGGLNKAQETEQLRKAKEAEDAAKAEQARKAKEAEDAAKAEQARKAKEAEDAAKAKNANGGKE